jgi:hypothetical protein
VARIEELENADVRDVDSLQELLYGLSAQIGVHVRERGGPSAAPLHRRDGRIDVCAHSVLAVGSLR